MQRTSLLWLLPLAVACGAPPPPATPAPSASPSTPVSIASAAPATTPAPAPSAPVAEPPEPDDDPPAPAPFDPASVPGARALLDELHLDASSLTSSLLSVLQGGYPFPAVVAASGLAASADRRLAFVKKHGPTLRQIMASKGLREHYAHERALALAQHRRSKPGPARGAAEIEQEQRRRASDALREQEKLLADPSVPADIKEAIRKALDDLKASTARAPAASGQMAEAERQQRQHEMLQWHERGQQLAQQWPADPDALLARRLDEFLALASRVDFAAKTSRDGSRRRFADEKLERESPWYKVLFRAGKPTVDAARSLATDWRKSLSPRP